MRNLYLIPLFLIFSVCHAAAQSSSVAFNPEKMQWSTCVDATYHLPVVIQGAFGANNTFTVEVRAAGYPNVIARLPAVLSGNELVFSFRNAALYESPAVQLRIVTTSPETQTTWLDQPVSVYSKGSVKLIAVDKADTLNLFDDFQVRLSGSSTSGGTVTFSDSSKVTLPDNAAVFNMLHTLVISQDGPYRIAHAENACGAMSVEGTIATIVNKTALKTLWVEPQAVCAGDEIKVGFSASGPALPGQARYKIRLTNIEVDGRPSTSVDVPAVLKDGYLTARIPAQFRSGDFQPYLASVVTENPALVGSPTVLRYSAGSAAVAKFISPGQTVNMTEIASLRLTVSGLGPFSAVLTDGTQQVKVASPFLEAMVRPDRTSSYRIVSATSGCSSPVVIDRGTVEVRVNPGIRFANDSTAQVLCAGTKARIGFVTNAVFTDATTFRIEGLNPQTNELVSLPAVRSGNQLEFEPASRAQGYSDFQYRIVTENPRVVSFYSQLIRIQTMPGIVYSEYNDYDFDRPSNAKLDFRLTGGGPYTLETPEGKLLEYSSNGPVGYDVYVKQSVDFRFKSLKNGCFTNTNPPAVPYRVTLSGKPAIALEPVKAVVCGSDSIEVIFNKLGTFGSDNRFMIQGYNRCCDYQTLATVTTAGRHKVKIPIQQFNYYASIRVVSTSPVVTSDPQAFEIQLLPENFRISMQGTVSDPIVVQPIQNSVDVELFAEKGSPERIRFTVNGQEHDILSPQSSNIHVNVPLTTGKNEFILQSVSNVCGTAPVNLKSYFYAVPYVISLPIEGPGRPYCLGAPARVSFETLYYGQRNAEFYLQVAKAGSNAYTTLASTRGRFFETTIPANLDTGDYTLRVLSSDSVVSNAQAIRIGTVPSAFLGETNSASVTAEAGKEVQIPLSLTGGGDWAVVFENNSKASYQSQRAIRTVTARNSGELFVKSVSNACGYGSAAGKVKLDVKPSLVVYGSFVIRCEGETFAYPYELAGTADLSDDYIRFDLIDTQSQTIIPLDSTKKLSGPQMLRMPERLSGSRYQIRTTVRKYELEAKNDIEVQYKPNVTLKGNTTITSGDKATLLVRLNRDIYQGATLTLSDGSKSYVVGLGGTYHTIEVAPKMTTTYTISSISNACGAGTFGGMATVEVLAPSERSVNVTGIGGIPFAPFCTGNELNVHYVAKGTFSASNKMTVQISDSTGRNFTDLPTTGSGSPLTAVIPANLPDAATYRVRVRASDAGTASGAYKDAIAVVHKSQARFASASVLYDGLSKPKITVLLEGSPPWGLEYGTGQEIFFAQATSSPLEITLQNALPNQEYRILSVTNGCGPGVIGSPSTVLLEVVAGLEPAGAQLQAIVFPNPSEERVVLQFQDAAPRQIRLTDMHGRLLLTRTGHFRQEEIGIGRLSAGMYMIRVDEGNKRGYFRLMKK